MGYIISLLIVILVLISAVAPYMGSASPEVNHHYSMPQLRSNTYCIISVVYLAVQRAPSPDTVTHILLYFLFPKVVLKKYFCA